MGSDPSRARDLNGYYGKRYIRTLIYILSLVIRDQYSYSNIGYISSSTRVHLTNNSAYEHNWPCSIFVTFTYLNLPDTTEPGWGDIPSITLLITATVIIGL